MTNESIARRLMDDEVVEIGHYEEISFQDYIESDNLEFDADLLRSEVSEDGLLLVWLA